MKRLYTELLRHWRPTQPYQYPQAQALFRGVPSIVSDNITEYYYAVNDKEFWDLTKDFPLMAPPFPAFWIEAHRPTKIVSEKHGETSSNILPYMTGCLFISEDLRKSQNSIKSLQQAVDTGKMGDGGAAEELIRKSKDARWSMHASLYASAHKEEIVGPIIFTQYLVNEDGTIVPADNGNPCNISGSYMDMAAHAEAIEEGLGLMKPIMLAIGFMNCKNVELSETTYPRTKKQIKKDEKNNIPEVKYHTIVLDSKGSATGGGEGEGSSKSLHIVRGHFSTYTKEKPLFGKHVGTFWVPAHTRGSSDVGTVEKGYEVNK